MNTANLLVVPATKQDETKLTVTVTGPKTADAARLIRVLAHILSDGSEWDDTIPNVELIVQREIEAKA
jgi:hypothetical protein